MNQMPQPANVPGPVWARVKAQLNREMTAVRFIENWFGQTGYMHSYADDLFLLKTMDDTAARLVFEKQRQNEVSMAAWEMVQGMLEAFSLPEIEGFKALGEALESVGEHMAVATAASLEFALIQEMDEIRGAYGHIQDELQNSFVDATSGFGDIKQASAVDYGLLMTLGQMASGWSQLTSDDEDHAQAAALRQYDLSVWQTLTQALWILQDYPDASGCASRSQSGDSVPCDLVDGVHHYILVSQEYGNPTISDEFREQLWEGPEEECLTSWNASCALDQTRAEVVFAYNGWPKLLYQRCKISESGAAWECTDTNR